jgi:hypothetical protein
MHIPAERSPIKVLLLTLITCGIYYLYWVYVTSQELDDALGETDIPPIVHVLLFIFTGTLWGFAWDVLTAREIAKLQAHAGLPTSDNTVLWLALDILGAGPIGGLGLIVPVLQQIAMNDLWRAMRGPGARERYPR